LSRPARLIPKAAQLLCYRINEAIQSGFCESVRVIFHGGEPLLFGKDRFAELCQALLACAPDGKVELCAQSNATLIDDEWIILFEKFAVNVGVSIDGPEEIHNRHRLDHSGRATFKETVMGIRKLVTAGGLGRISRPAALIVAQSNTDPRDIYKFVVEDLGITRMDFLLPDGTHDQSAPVMEVGPYLCRLFDCWSDEEKDGVEIRLLQSSLSLLLGGSSFLGGFGPKRSTALTVLSDGEINGDDFLRPCGDDVIKLGKNVFENSFAEAFDVNEKRLRFWAADQLPENCSGCAFEKICCGGQLTHRYRSDTKFNNSSIYCSGLKQFFEYLCLHAVNDGFDVARLEQTLRGNARPITMNSPIVHEPA